jgi:hypothetical protein
MKRISVYATIILVIVTGAIHASEYHYSTQYRVRWSPYTHSLVCGDVKYSPYVFGHGGSGVTYGRIYYSPYAKRYGNTGLVYDNVRYSPYAFGLKSSGLIAEPWGECCSSPYLRPYGNAGPCVVVYNKIYQPSRSSTKSGPEVYLNAKKEYRAKKAAREANLEMLKQRRAHHVEKKKLNAEDVIAAFLTLKNINYRTNRILSVNNKLVSIDFMLPGRIIIKYWNPEEILALKRQKNSGILYYDSYMESYKNFASEYLSDGGRIYQIATADNKEILKKLFELDELKAERKSSDTTVVAKANEESTALEVAN